MSLPVCQHCDGPVVWSRVPFGRFVHESTGETTCPPGALLHSLVISATHGPGEYPECDRMGGELVNDPRRRLWTCEGVDF